MSNPVNGNCWPGPGDTGRGSRLRVVTASGGSEFGVPLPVVGAGGGFGVLLPVAGAGEHGSA